MKKGKSLKQAHTSNSPKGMGDYYGSGIKNPIGRVRDSYMPQLKDLGSKKLRTPPRSLG